MRRGETSLVPRKLTSFHVLGGPSFREGNARAGLNSEGGRMRLGLRSKEPGIAPYPRPVLGARELMQSLRYAS